MNTLFCYVILYLKCEFNFQGVFTINIGSSLFLTFLNCRLRRLLGTVERMQFYLDLNCFLLLSRQMIDDRLQYLIQFNLKLFHSFAIITGKVMLTCFQLSTYYAYHWIFFKMKDKYIQSIFVKFRNSYNKLK